MSTPALTNPGTQAIRPRDHWGHSPKDTLLTSRPSIHVWTLLHSSFWRFFWAGLFYNPVLPAQDLIRNPTQFPHKSVFNCGAGRKHSLISPRVLPSSLEREPWDQFPSPDGPQTSWNEGGAGSQVGSTVTVLGLGLGLGAETKPGRRWGCQKGPREDMRIFPLVFTRVVVLLSTEL